LCKICGGQGGIGPRFSLCTSVFPYHYHATSAACTFSCTVFFYHKEKWTKLENLPKINVALEIAEYCVEKVVHFLKTQRA
jgi:hypothetical protein